MDQGMGAPLTSDDLAALARLTTPTLANAIETFGLRPNTEGFSGPEIRQLFPDLGAMVGYACTLRIAAETPSPHGTGGAPVAYWESVAASPGPRVVVVQDLDPVPVGAFWGEVNSNVHKSLGCIGTVTQGGVRDLEEMRRIGFHVYASSVLVSHAYVRVVDFGQPVQIGRLTVRPRDLIHADQHGVLVIPGEIARDLPRVAAEIERLEREIIACCRAPGFTPRKLADVWNSAVSRWPKSRATPGRDTMETP
jgi:4-hydroxy-4-methyl-2-oxoglutarate aldolase